MKERKKTISQLFNSIKGFRESTSGQKALESKLKYNKKVVEEDTEKINNIFDNISEALFTLDENLKITYFNHSAEKMLNKKSREVGSKYIFDVFKEGKGSVFDEKFHQAIIEKKYMAFEVFFENELYRSRYEVRIFPQKIGIAVCFQIINERKIMPDALMSSEERLSHLLASITDYIYSVKIESGRPVETYHGAGCFNVTGYTAEEFASDQYLWYEIVYIDDRQSVTEQAANLLIGKTASPLEHRIIHIDGTIRWIRNTPVLLYDSQGILIGYDGMISDITERKKAETIHSEWDEKYKILLESTDEIITVAQDGVLKFANSNLLKLTGFTMDDINTSSFLEKVYPKDRDMVKGYIFKRREGQKVPENYSFRFIDKNDKVKWFERHVSGILWEKKPAVLVFDKDITNRKKLDEELEKSEKRFRMVFERALSVWQCRTRTSGSSGSMKHFVLCSVIKKVKC